MPQSTLWQIARWRVIRHCLQCRQLRRAGCVRLKFPKLPGDGIAKAAGLIRFRSLLRNGLTPAIKFGRRIFRELPPPGVLTTAANPTGNAVNVPLNVGKLATNPFAKKLPAPSGQPAASWHWTTTSGLTTNTSMGTPLRAFRIPPTSHPPSKMLPVLPKSNFLPLPNGNS